jgi:hypothetical protein
MPSTYSPLKFELIAVAEQDGIWGVTTNVNLGTAIEQAITGSEDVVFTSSDVTLTLTDTNESQTARNLRLVCTGTSGGARQLIVPDIEKQYIVQNDLADAVTIRTSAGTGVTVPSGTTTSVFNNGVDVVPTVNYLDTLAVTTLNATTINGAINASNISSGTISNARTTANSANSASTIVARDSNGSFGANVVTIKAFSTANFTVTQVGTALIFQYDGANIAVMSAGGNVTSAGQFVAGGSV